LQQAKLWLITDPGERVAKLEGILEEYPKQMHRRLMLFDAALRGDEALVRCIVATGLKVFPDIPESPPSEEEERADQEARENGEIPDMDNPTTVPVHTAAYKGHLGCLRILLEEGNVNVDVRDGVGRTPLITGAKHPELVQYVLGLGADLTLRMYTEEDRPKENLGEFGGADALEFAAAGGSVESLKSLLEHPFHGSKRKRKNHAHDKPGVWVTALSIKAAAEADGGFDALHPLLERGTYPMETLDGKTKGEQLSTEEYKAIVDAIPGTTMRGSLSSLKLLLSYQYPTEQDGTLLPFDLPEELHKPFVYGAYGAKKTDSTEKFEFINSFGITEHETMSLDKLPLGQKLNIQHLFDELASAGSIECARLLTEKYGAEPNKHRAKQAPCQTSTVYRPV
jgi:hypothetical protein